MIILGTPDDLSGFIAVEDCDNFPLEQKGWHPQYMENGMFYYKKSAKLLKIIEKMGIKLVKNDYE